ncbi:hypothetical protein GWK47_008036 [Chionoecetes opilio]|uniref:Uncharacterized protein n=1 Tax=Chionoecetes opilio TaxID=41210 RepID=A0A8J4XZT0_CHIOP|nr:hypothetical protein GWK47_008036 [Chionoecetes opilio]
MAYSYSPYTVTIAHSCRTSIGCNQPLLSSATSQASRLSLQRVPLYPVLSLLRLARLGEVVRYRSEEAQNVPRAHTNETLRRLIPSVNSTWRGAASAPPPGHPIRKSWQGALPLNNLSCDFLWLFRLAVPWRTDTSCLNKNLKALACETYHLTQL